MPSRAVFAASTAIIVAITALALVSGHESAFARSAARVDTPGAQAIIVMRHGHDAAGCVTKDNPQSLSATWKLQAPKWPNHEFPGVAVSSYGAQGNVTMLSSVPVLQHCLSTIGEQQAMRLAEELPQILTDHNLAPVTRVVVINPSVIVNGEYATANPFDTVLPFIMKDQRTSKSIKSIDLLCNNGCAMVGSMSKQLFDLVPNHGLLASKVVGGSTLVCWTGEGLNESIGDSKALLELLAGGTITNEINNLVKTPCMIGQKSMGYEKGKGNVLYIFTPRPFSAATDEAGTVDAAPMNPHEGEQVQAYDLKVFQALTAGAVTDPTRASFCWTHTFSVNYLPPTDLDPKSFESVTIQFPKSPASLLLSQ